MTSMIRLAVLLVAVVFGTFDAYAQQSATSQEPKTSLNVRLEQAEPFRMAREEKSTLVAILTGPFGGGIAGALAAAAGVFIAHLAGRSTLNQKSNEAELKDIQERLDAFYGPFALRSAENKLISSEFRKKQGGEDFRTLVALLNPTWKDSLSNADKNLLKKMIDNGAALNNLIREKSGHVAQSLLPDLARASAHFTLLEMAYNNQLDDDPDRFRQYAYPRELDDAIDKEIASLNRRVDLLLRYPGKKHSPRVDNDSYGRGVSPFPALVSIAVLVAILTFPVISLATEGAFPSHMLKLSNVLAAGITGLVSSLFWMVSARDVANKTANSAAAGFSGATVVFGLSGIGFSGSEPSALQWIIDHWALLTFAFATILVAGTTVIAWQKSRPA